QKKWANYYRPESRAKQAAFFDHFLKGRDGGIEAWPRLRIEVRESAAASTWRAEGDWPLASTRETPLWLDASRATLSPQAVEGEASVAYDPCDEAGEAVFEHRFAEETELTGPMKLKLWVSAEGADDMDLFVALQKRDASGGLVGFHFYAFYDNGPVA